MYHQRVRKIRESCEFNNDDDLRAKFITHNINIEFWRIDRRSIQVGYVSTKNCELGLETDYKLL